MLKPIGFDNSYCTVMTEKMATELSIETLSDLSRYPKLRGAFSFEFQERKDGWHAMKALYDLKQSVRGMDVPLTYEALINKEVDFVEAYSTEPIIKKYKLRVLKDDKNFFPKYDALALVHKSLPIEARHALNELAGLINNDLIIDLNTQAINGISFAVIANDFLLNKGLLKSPKTITVHRGIDWKKMWQRTLAHMYLTLLAVLAATLIAVPLATLIAPHQKISRFVLGFAGVMQTIPSIALLTFMIPFFGIGFKPAIVGLFIYSLLPILQNTHIAMSTIGPKTDHCCQRHRPLPQRNFIFCKVTVSLPHNLSRHQNRHHFKYRNCHSRGLHRSWRPR